MSGPSLYLLTPPIADADAFLPVFRAVLAAADVAAVLLTIPAGDDKAALRHLKPLVAAAQEAGAAVLLNAPSDTRLVARAGADGAHYPVGFDGLADALADLKPGAIVGVGGIRTRHEAMDMGERDIDYLMFGEPRPDGFVPELDKTVERAGWWAPIFTIPAVAYAADLAAVSAVAATGAEFIGLGVWLFQAADPAATMGEARRLADSSIPSQVAKA